MGPVSAIVLAAGESRRMGSLKPLLPYGSRNVIQSVVHSLTLSRVDHIFVVLGHRSEEIAAVLAGTAATPVLNPNYASGMLTSVQAGMGAAPAETEWFLLALGDQPWVGAELVDQLLEVAAATGRGLVVPSYNERRGHPLVIHRDYRAEILELPATGTLRSLFSAHPADVRYVVVDQPAILEDMDTPEDYARALGESRCPDSTGVHAA